MVLISLLHPPPTDTLSAHFAATGTGPRDYDLVVTGDLGALGPPDRVGPLRPGRSGYGRELHRLRPAALRYSKSGHARRGQRLRLRGVGAVRLPAGEMERGRWRRILFAPTGALLSPTSTCQGRASPPSVTRWSSKASERGGIYVCNTSTRFSAAASYVSSARSSSTRPRSPLPGS